MPFVKYPHLERFGNVEVDGIECGVCHIFPKIDGTNASIWFEDGLRAGSRNRELTLESDNAGFFRYVSEDSRFLDLVSEYPNHNFYGEWLVPHSLTSYRYDAWRKFYIFDVWDGEKFLHYDEYAPILKDYGLDFIPCYKMFRNPGPDDLVAQTREIRFLLKDDCKQGEGIVIKNYQYQNTFGRTTWAKMITPEFKESHVAVMGAPEAGGMCNEEILVDKFVTEHLIRKTHAKIALDGWESRNIPQLLETTFYDFVREELYDALKEIKFGTVNFKALRNFTVQKIKTTMPELF